MKLDLDQANKIDNFEKLPEYKLLNFDIPQEFSESIQKSLLTYKYGWQDIVGSIYRQTSFGKTTLRPFKIHPNFVIQQATQMAYYNRYKIYPSTYETATIRKFYNGRTETARTMTKESKNFIDMMNSKKPDNLTQLEFDIKKKEILMKAHKRYLEQKKECSNFEGFDRYLLAIDNIPGVECSLRCCDL